MSKDKRLTPEFIRLLALVAYKEGEISEERCCEVTGFKRDDLRKEMERRCGLSRPYTDLENMIEHQLQQYKAALEYIREQLQQIPGGPDLDADELNERPDDIAQHIAGLCIKRINETIGEELD